MPLSLALDREIAAKRSELSPKNPTTVQVLQALVSDAATAWKSLRMVEGKTADLYAFKGVRLFSWESAEIQPWQYEAFAKLVAAIEMPETLGGLNLGALTQAISRKKLTFPTPSQARRMRVVVEEIPHLLRPTIVGDVATGVIRAKQRRMWAIVWYDATGVNASDLGKTMKVKRGAIWKARKGAYEQLASAIEFEQFASAIGLPDPLVDAA